MANRLLLLACDPGGANIVKVLVRPLERTGFVVELYGVGPALSIFAEEDLIARDLPGELSPRDPLLAELQRFLESTRPNLVLTGTSGEDFHERLLCQAANSLGIPSVAVLDQWINYGLRFSRYGLSQSPLYQSNPEHPYLPETVCVMDQLALNEMVDEGLPAERLVITGHPYLERVQKEKPSGSPQAARDRLGIPAGDLVMLFASEPLSEAYASSIPLGYTEKTIFKEILSCLETVDETTTHNITLIIKLHPKETSDFYQSILTGKAFRRIRVRIEQSATAPVLFPCVDCVIGMASTLLLEAALCNIPIVSVQIGGSGRNPFVLCRSGNIRAVMSREELLETLRSLLVERRLTGTAYRTSEAATANVIQLIREKTGHSKMQETQTSLALHGGPPTRIEKFPASRTMGQEEKDAVCRVIDSGILSRFLGTWHEDFYGGPEVRALEQEWARYFRVKHAVAVNSATSGLYAAVGAAGIEPGDEVIVSPYTMSASAVAPLIYSAIPIFADVESVYYCLDAKSVEARITPKTRAIIIVDLFGLPYDRDGIHALAKKHNLCVIEDCAQAPGAFYGERPAGTLGDIGIYSLNYHKHIHTGEGGVVVTDDDEIAEKLRLIRNHAESVVLGKGHEALSNMVGFNYRMTELEAAVGRVQLQKLEGLLAKRQSNVAYLSEKLAEIPCITPARIRPGCTHSFYLHTLAFDSKVAGFPRNKFVDAVKAELPLTELRETEGVKVGAGYVLPIYLQPMFQKKIAFGSQGHPWSTFSNGVDYSKGICPTVESLYEEVLITHELMRPSFSRADLDDVVTAFHKVWQHRAKLEA